MAFPDLQIILEVVGVIVAAVAAWFAWRGWLGQRRLARGRIVEVRWDHVRYKPPKRPVIVVMLTALRNRVVPTRVELAARKRQIRGVAAPGSTFGRRIEEGQAMAVIFDFEDVQRVHVDKATGPIRWVVWYDVEQRRHRDRIDARWAEILRHPPPPENERVR